ncbi:MAG: hypothetical protein ABL953_07385 [Ilumatobacteraceae bacterium]
MSEVVRVRSTRVRLSTVAWVVLAVLAAIQLPTPFLGDQALFAVGGDILANGGVIYRDFWDIKQPGIYLYFAVASWLPGSIELAVHVLDSLCWLGVALLLGAVARTTTNRPVIATLVPLLTVGSYLAGARPNDLSQIESLLALPLLASMWLAVGPPAQGPHRTRALVLTGVLTAVVGILKIVYMPIVGAIWLLAAWRRWRDLVPLLLGCAAVIAGVVTYFAAVGVLDDAWFIYFDYSLSTTASAGRPLSRLAEWPRYMAPVFAVVGPLGLVGLWRVARRQLHEPLYDAAALCILVSVPFVLIQHWWPYHSMLFLAPFGVLAIPGLELALRWGRPVLLFGLAASLLPIITLGERLGELARHDFAITADARREYQRAVESTYTDADRLAALLNAPESISGDIYVLSNPLFQLRSGRKQAIAINGWAPEQYDVKVWSMLSDQLREADPAYVLVDEYSHEYLVERAPALHEWLHAGYCDLDPTGFELLARNDASTCDV